MRAIYDSGFHHPFVAFVVGAILLFAIARRLPFLYGYLVVFLVEILADACVTGAWSPVPSGTTTYTVLSVLFVVLGDLRYFFLVDRVTRAESSVARVLAFVVPVSLIVPVTTGLLSRVVPAMQDDRVLYFVYELAALTLVLGLQRFRFAPRAVAAEQAVFVRRVTLFFATLYFGWAASDALILAGVDAGHLLRIVPNVLYYALFLPFVLRIAPPSVRAMPAAVADAP